MARARDVHLRCDETFAAAAGRVLRARAEELLEHSAGVLDMDEVERVHDMRVASRRLRAAMEVFEPCFPRKRFRTVLKDVKAIADALGERRDRDVAIAALQGFSNRVAAADRPGIELMIGRLRDEQELANARLAGVVDQRRLAGLHERIEGLVEARVGEPA